MRLPVHLPVSELAGIRSKEIWAGSLQRFLLVLAAALDTVPASESKYARQKSSAPLTAGAERNELSTQLAASPRARDRGCVGLAIVRLHAGMAIGSLVVGYLRSWSCCRGCFLEADVRGLQRGFEFARSVGREGRDTHGYSYVDHLNTPRLVANSSGTTVWRWDQQEPFGVNVPDENPSGLGMFEVPLRYPGQYADKETNLFYNYFRDYDAGLGRYEESDPIGLKGGLNTYAYVNSQPTRFSDPLGLKSRICCKRLGATLLVASHCYVEPLAGGRRSTVGLLGSWLSGQEWGRKYHSK